MYKDKSAGENKNTKNKVEICKYSDCQRKWIFIYICIHPYKSRCIKHIILHFETMASNIPFSLFKSMHEEDIFTYTSYIVVIISYCYHLDGDFIDDFSHHYNLHREQHTLKKVI